MNAKPEWFTIGDSATAPIMGRIADILSASELPAQVRFHPLLAHWFLLDTLALAHEANRQGMHANAIILTRPCVEAISVIELGICDHPSAEEMLEKWGEDRLDEIN